MAALTVPVVFLLLIPACLGLEWTSVDVPNGTTLIHCKGDDVPFPWHFNVSREETILTVNWYFSDGKNEKHLATYVSGHFFPIPGLKGTLEYLPTAGIKLYNVTLADMGLYSVRINLNQAGVVASSAQTAKLALPDAPILREGRLSVAVMPGTMYNDVTNQWHVQLSCGQFAKLGAPPASVLWRTPRGVIVRSSFQNNGSFTLVLQNPVEGGQYVCFLDTSSPTLGCTKGFPTSRAATANVTVDAVEPRLLVLEAHLTGLKDETRRVLEQVEDKYRLVNNVALQNKQQKDLVYSLTSAFDQQKELVASLAAGAGKHKEQVKTLASDFEKEKKLVRNVTSDLAKHKQLEEAMTSALEQQKEVVASLDYGAKKREILIRNLTSTLKQQGDVVTSLASRAERQDVLVTNLTLELSQQKEVFRSLMARFGQYEEAVANVTSRMDRQEGVISNMTKRYNGVALSSESESDPSNCLDILKLSGLSDVYTVRVGGKSIEVLCDLGWTVIQRRHDGSVNFYRGWAEYEKGFGDLRGEFWLGLDAIYRMTTTQNHTLRVDMESAGGASAYAQYREFRISSVADNYRLRVNGYNGTAGDSLSSWHSSQQFTTYDRDHDTYSGNCAVDRQGAWWYKSCDVSNLNGPYRTPGRFGDDGIIWDSFGGGKSLKSVVMKIRPQ